MRAPELPATIAQTGVDSTLEGRALLDATLSAIAGRRGYLSWDVDHPGWLVSLHSPDEETFHGRTREEALTLVWLMASEIGVGQFLVSFAVKAPSPNWSLLRILCAQPWGDGGRGSPFAGGERCGTTYFY